MRRALLLAFCPLAACAANAPHGVRPLRPLELATAPYQEATGTSLTGSLLYESGCLLFRDDATKARLLPVWPTGSIFNGTALIFHQPGKADQPVMIGEEFVMEGERREWGTLWAPTYPPFRYQCGALPFMVGRVHPAN